MNTVNAENLHRLVKLALDSGEASTIEEAQAIFSQYRVRIHLGQHWERTAAGEAAFLTAVNTAARAFLGGVVVTGDVSPRLTVPLFRGKVSGDAAAELGASIATDFIENIPTLLIGEADCELHAQFCVRIVSDGWYAGITPVSESEGPMTISGNPLAGVAAAALGINEAFLHVRGELASAGHRIVGMSLWAPSATDNWESAAQEGPGLQFLPKSLWIVGLGHLGQAYSWVIGMLPYEEGHAAELVLQDVDFAASSNLSTCMLTTSNDLGRPKTRFVAERLEQAGFKTRIVERRFNDEQRIAPDEPAVGLFGVDNIIARRAIDSAGFGLAIEAGLGSGYQDFRNIRLHTFPGRRKAIEIWSAADAVQQAVQLAPAYERMAQDSDNRCGVTLLATRAVATPFVGALAAALVLTEAIRVLHDGIQIEAADVPMKDLRHRTIARRNTPLHCSAGFVPVR